MLVAVTGLVDSPVIYTATFEAGWQDVAELQALMRQGFRPGNEDAERDAHLNELIPKPWGYEYRAYADDLLDMWQLCLRPGHRTSMHAHPRKVTYLLCLRGQGYMEGLRGRVEVAAGQLVRIDRGAFHQTVNTASETDLHLIEVETPRNKLDLVRLRDVYNRVGKGYEHHSVELHSVYKRVPYIPGAYMCRTSPCGEFGFAVTSGMDLHYRGVSSGEFHIPIGFAAFLHADLPILHSGAGSTPDHETYYLSVLRSPRNR